MPIRNNVVLNSYNKALQQGSRTVNVVVRNNILDGCIVKSGPTVSHNIYTSLTWNQQARYGWKLGAGERVVDDKKVLFVDPVNRDYRLTPNSPAIDTDVGQSIDHAGAPVPAGPASDIGAYEFGAVRKGSR